MIWHLFLLSSECIHQISFVIDFCNTFIVREIGSKLGIFCVHTISFDQNYHKVCPLFLSESLLDLPSKLVHFLFVLRHNYLLISCCARVFLSISHYFPLFFNSCPLCSYSSVLSLAHGVVSLSLSQF